jgi:NADPH:quinone reductase-like Zn-dependent oxidoreductase
MIAIVRDRYGPPDVLRVEELPTPQPAAGEVVIDVHAVAVTAADLKVRGLSGIPRSMYWPARAVFGLIKPKQRILGGSFAGVVAEVGEGFDRFAIGDRVVGYTGLRFGAYAECVVLPGDAVLAKLPENVSFEAAAPLSHGAQTAMYFLREAELADGESILIHGASGACGSFAVQLAKQAGAHVTATASPAKLDFVRDLGADVANSYHDLTNGTFDIILDCHGSLPYAKARRHVNRGGRLVPLAFGITGPLIDLPRARFLSGHRILFGVTKETSDDLAELVGLLATDVLRSPVGGEFDLTRAAEAHALADSGRAPFGSILLKPGMNDDD